MLFDQIPEPAFIIELQDPRDLTDLFTGSDLFISRPADTHRVLRLVVFVKTFFSLSTTEGGR
ncbi:hypothetical protein Mpal_0043 [Methanosphaerula palustris E1-9c]|uniref:Uncharacterized protein n=1 Tax=Methanosphaerula palustris (strain ATCC BAA-1556 / DSM 19958 / E1-9c) TaxID=521011 RepID=B8GI88_METPE|nr:hypothetical protein Mpal_0043 [Methanosphaerula palustris E1-9c]